MLPGTMEKRAMNWNNQSCANEDPRETFALVESLAASRLCEGLEWEEVAILAAEARLRRFGPLREAVSEGSRASDIYVVVKGRFIVLLPSQQLDSHGSGAIVNLDSFICGDCFGHGGLVDEVSAPASIIATEPSEVISLSLDAIDSFVAEHARRAAIIFRNLFAIQTRRLSLLSG